MKPAFYKGKIRKVIHQLSSGNIAFAAEIFELLF